MHNGGSREVDAPDCHRTRVSGSPSRLAAATVASGLCRRKSTSRALRRQPRWRSRRTAGCSSASRPGDCASSMTACCLRRPSSRWTSMPTASAACSVWRSTRTSRRISYVYVYYTARTPTIAQPREPLHGRRRHRARGQRSRDSRPRRPLRSATNHNGGAHALRPRRQALRRRRRQRERRQRADARRTGSARSCASTPTARSPPTTRSIATRDRRQPRDLGATACAIRSRSRCSRRPAACSSTTSARTPGRRSTRGWPAPTTAGRLQKGRRPIRPSRIRFTRTATSTGGCAITGGAFYNRRRAAFPSEYVGDYFFGDYCLRDDQQVRHGDGRRQRLLARTSGVPWTSTRVRTVRSTTSRARDTAPKVYRVRFTGQSAPRITQQPASRTLLVGQSVTFTVVASGTAPLHYQWRRNGVDIAGANSAELPFRLRTAERQRRRIRRRRDATTLGTATSNVAHADSHDKHAADRVVHPASERNDVRRRRPDPVRGDRQAMRRTAPCRRARSRGGSTCTTTRTRHPQVLPFSGAKSRLVRDPGERRDLGQRLLSHQPARDGFGGTHANTHARRQAAQDRGHARNRTGRAAIAARRSAGH